MAYPPLALHHAYRVSEKTSSRSFVNRGNPPTTCCSSHPQGGPRTATLVPNPTQNAAPSEARVPAGSYPAVRSCLPSNRPL